MRVPLSWLRDYVDLPAGETGRSVAARLVPAGHEVETVEVVGAGLSGPVVVGQVLDIEELAGFKKPIRYCTVGVGHGQSRGIVCGASNFADGDKVVVALPGAVLPGEFAIGARQAYGRTSDGMICSSRELGIGDDSTGILVLPGDAEVGTDAATVLGLRDEVLDIAVTANRGDCLSIRGIARETATAYGVAFRDPAAPAPGTGTHHPSTDHPSTAPPGPSSYPVEVDDPAGCPVFAALTVTGIDPAAPSPLEIQRRVRLGGMRPISLAVDVTNYVMLELGQPLHAYDRAKLQGPIRVRRAQPDERLETLDGVKRDLGAGNAADTPDLLITDDSGPIGIAGVMGGASTEISAATVDIVLEAATFAPATVAHTSRRHRLPSEASRRFERGVDPVLGVPAALRAAELLVRHGGGRIDPAPTVVGTPPPPAPLHIPADLPARVVGRPYAEGEVVSSLEAVGCSVQTDGGDLEVRPPTWRPDLVDPFDLVEEVARLHGYDTIPSVLPRAPAGRGLTPDQRLRRRVGRALASAGYVEAPAYPFVGPSDWEALALPADDARRRALRLANPLSEEEPLLRTTLLPGLLRTLRRNVSRGAADVALYETGLVFRPREGAPPARRLGVDRRPTDDEIAALGAALPDQPLRVGVLMCGRREAAGWWGAGREVTWADAIEAARTVAGEAGLGLTVTADAHAPWHPGRCAALHVGAVLVGHAGELAPGVAAAYGVPPRSCAMELDLTAVAGAASDAPVPAPRVSPYPVATQDVALVVALDQPAGEVQAALADGAGPLLESVRLFDVYTGESVEAGRKSLGYALRFRAPDRTLTVEEASAARESAVAEAARRTGAVPRGG